jgi:hypothetical protein
VPIKDNWNKDELSDVLLKFSNVYSEHLISCLKDSIPKAFDIKKWVKENVY